MQGCLRTIANFHAGKQQQWPAKGTSVPRFPPSVHRHAAKKAKGHAVGEPTQPSSSSSGIQLRLLPRHEGEAGAYLQGTANSHQGCSMDTAVGYGACSMYVRSSSSSITHMHRHADKERRALLAEQQG